MATDDVGETTARVLSGRFSSSNLNPQNIPIRTHEGHEIRSAFKAGNLSWLLFAIDYSQIELRCWEGKQ